MNLERLYCDQSEIVFGDEIFEYLTKLFLKENYSKVFILADSNTNDFCVPIFMAQFASAIEIEIVEIEAGEQFKNIETCVGVWESLTLLKADRKSLMINIGGGVVTDLGGFIASTYKRGIDFIHVPTSLLGMVDAAIGGKNGIDLGVLKNQIGLFQPPKAVLINDIFLETLPANQMRSGLSEMLKHGLIYNKNHWNKLIELEKLHKKNLIELIFESVNIKIDIVTKDPFEKNIRKALNFGHTIGHAIESYFLALPQNNSVLHGEAVAAGMIIESYISHKMGFLDFESYKLIQSNICKYFPKLPLNKEDIEVIIPYLMHDKKNIKNQIYFVFLDNIGSILINQTCTDELIVEALESYIN